MRIAQIAPLRVSVPPQGYGGTERVISNLTEALVQQGHDVTLFASGDSRTSARLIPYIPSALGFHAVEQASVFEIAMLTEVYRQAKRFDIIHSHLEMATLPFTRRSITPTVLTLHSRLDQPAPMRLMRLRAKEHYVSISDSQRAPIPNAHWAGTVYHGMDISTFPFRSTPGTYLTFVGRIAPEKAPDRAIDIARRAGVRLVIAAKVDPKDRAYFRERIEPLLDDPLIDFLGPLGERQKRQLLENALGLLLPIDWPEPFGMVFIEALACGTPVLTRPVGSAPEILRDGVTGFMRDTNEELAAAVRELPDISRRGCRAYVEERFTSARMARDYTTVYERVLPRTARASQTVDIVSI